MHPNVDAIIAELSIQLFQIPPASVQDALAVSSSATDQSLADVLSIQGLLREDEKRLLDSLSDELLDHEAATRTGFRPAFLSNWAIRQSNAFPAGDYGASGIENDLDSPGEAGDRYQVRVEHGRGGMGRVLAVWDRRMRREVALKELLPADASKDEPALRHRVVARFLREARITGRLQHPSIIPVHEIGKREDGTLYYTMKFVRGRTLQEAIADAPDLEGRMLLLPHYLDLCQAIAYAHAHGVIHRDIKPSNVMIGEFGETLVIDWGLAKEIARGDGEEMADGGGAAPDDCLDEGAGELTVDGQLLGTPHYMPPEQAAGKHHTLDERTDVYALGAVLYHLLTGNRPYQASSGLEVLRKAATDSPTPPELVCPEAPPSLAAICNRAMNRDPSSRYPSAEVLAEEIARFQSGARVRTYDYGLAELMGRFLRRHRAAVATACVAVCLLAGLGCYSYLSLRASNAAEHALRVESEREGYDLSIMVAGRNLEEFRYDQAQSILDACPPEYRSWEWGRLAHAARTVKYTLSVPEGRIWESALSPDGRYLASTKDENEAVLWDLSRRQAVRTFHAHDAELEAVAFHPNGREFATCAADGSIKRWDTASPAMLAQYEIPGTVVRTVAYTPDGRFLVSGGSDSTLTQWDLAAGAVARTFPEPAGEVNNVALSPDGRRMAAGDIGGFVYLWDWDSGRCLDVVEGHTNHRQIGTQGTLRLAFSRDSTMLATSGCDATAKIWDLEPLALRYTLTGHLKKVWSVDFSPDGNTLVTSSEQDAKFWDTRSGKEQPTWIKSAQSIVRAQYLPSGQFLVTTGGEPDITLWDLSARSNGDFLTGHTAEVNAVFFSPDGRYLASAAGHWLEGGDGRVLVWDCGPDGQATPAAPNQVLAGGRDWVNSVAFHPNGRWVSSGDASGKMLTWDWRTGALLREIPVAAYSNGLRCLAYSPDGATFATTGWAALELGVVTLWDTESGTPLRELTGPTRTIDSVAYSPGGRYLAAGSRDGTARVWDVSTGETIQVLAPVDAWVSGVAFSPDGRTLATSHGSSSVLLWDVQSGAMLHRLEGLHTRAEKVIFSPDGARVASCDSAMVKVWNAVTGAPLLALPHGALDLAFSPDGRTLATAGMDGRVGLWHSVNWRD